MSRDELIHELRLAIEEGDSDAASTAAEQCLKGGIDPVEAVERGLREALRTVGERFERLEVYLPEMMLAADASNAVMEVLEPALLEEGKHTTSPGIVIIGTAKGDIHTIGKNIVVMLLKLSGFQVHDLGEDVPATEFIEAARKNNADIVAISALMTSTMPGQRDVVNLLEEMGLRDKFGVIVGGAPTTQEWAEQIGADGYSETAPGAVELCLSLVKK
jgi:corrinoid protein of di/trimethylamine methyltransferase